MSLSTDQTAPTSCKMGFTSLCEYHARVLAIFIDSGSALGKTKGHCLGYFPFHINQ